MKKIFILLLITITLIPIGDAFAQSNPDKRHIDSLCQAGRYEEAYQYAKQRRQSLSPDKSQAYKNATADYYGTVYLLEMIYRYQEKFEEALTLNEEMLALMKPKTDYFAIRNKIVCYSGLGNYEKAAENRALLYKAYKKKKLPCEYELCNYYNFDFFKIDTLNIWGYEWYDKLPKNRFSTSFTKVVYYVYSTNPDGSDKYQLYRLHLIMFHGTNMPFDYIMEKHISTENGERRHSLYQYTYKENIDYKKLHNDVIEIVNGGKKNDTQQSALYKAIEDFNLDTVSISLETIEPREKTEYVSTEPYQDIYLIYGRYRHLDISLNGTVKSVVQTKVPVSLLKKNNSSKNVYVQQQTWKFSPTGHLYLCHINKTFIKDILDYDINDNRTLYGDKYDSTHIIAYYSFNSIGQMNQAINENYNSKETFKYDKNGHLTKVETYYWDTHVLNEMLITLNDDGKPVRVIERRNSVKDDINTYCYDERGNKVAHQRNNGKTALYMEAFVYDSLDNMILMGHCRRYHGDNNSCECEGFSAGRGYEYDDRHNMIRDYSIGDWKPNGMDTYYQYDSEGREIESKHYEVRGSQRTFDSHIQTTYDSAGRIVKKEALLGDFSVHRDIFILYFKNAILEAWTYDEYGNIEQYVVYVTKVKPYKIVRYQYTYDQHGNWVKRVQYEGVSDDSMTATEVMERRIEYYE
ncbi:MAG: tetratricopeptide repeat protein [Bacteroidales bacterium]|nr:tetratricopeptide repeat protein [Bacteroidales bacterium]